MNINTTDKVQVGDSTAGTSTTTAWHCPYQPSKVEQGWECPRCGRINAPWKSQCDCSGNNWTITCKPEWWKDYVTCGQADDITKNPNIYTVGGSDYKVAPNTYVNVNGTQSNKVEPNVTAWNSTNPDNCHTPHYTTKTYPNNICENH